MLTETHRPIRFTLGNGEAEVRLSVAEAEVLVAFLTGELHIHRSPVVQQKSDVAKAAEAVEKGYRHDVV